MQITNAISDLLLEIDEVWLDYAARLALSSFVTAADVELEELLFSAAKWLEDAEQRTRTERGLRTLCGQLESTLRVMQYNSLIYMV